jgi:hypothetical protein
MVSLREGFDEFGNPIGKAFELGSVDDELLSEERILLFVVYDETLGKLLSGTSFRWDLAQESVAERNIQMDIRVDVTGKSLTEELLNEYTQLWFVSGMVKHLSGTQVKMVREFIRQGSGLFIWADNQPFYADANLLAQAVVGTKFSGNKQGDQVMELCNELRPGCFIEHPLTQGINSLYEGRTISSIAPAPDLTILAKSHDKQNSMACFERDDQRVVLDTGFTKLLGEKRFYKTAGTARYIRNIAFWLSKATRSREYTIFTPGRENLAVIQSGGVSEHFQYSITDPLILAYVLSWEGSARLGLTIQDPQGRNVVDTDTNTPPLRTEVAADIPGDWVCQVKGVDVPHPDLQYVLTLVVNKEKRAEKPVPASIIPQAAPPIQEFSASADILCSTCRTPLRTGARFCRQCGSTLQSPQAVSTLHCPSCGAEVRPGVYFCRSCGTSL